MINHHKDMSSTIFNLLLIAPKTTNSGLEPFFHHELKPPTSIINRENALYLAHEPSLWGHFLNWEPIFQNDSSSSWRKTSQQKGWEFEKQSICKLENEENQHHSIVHFQKPQNYERQQHDSVWGWRLYKPMPVDGNSENYSKCFRSE